MVDLKAFELWIISTSIFGLGRLMVARSIRRARNPLLVCDEENQNCNPLKIPYITRFQQSILDMATIFESSLSTSITRPPFSTDAPSMADTLPSVNFGFDELRDRMARFTVKFDDFIEKGRKRVLEERNQFRINVAELQGMVCL